MPQSVDDLVYRQRHVVALRVSEVHDVVGPKTFDGVVERVQEHPATELTVRDDIQAEIDLPAHRVADCLVLELLKSGSVLRALVGQDRRMTGFVERLDRESERPGTQQRPDDLCSSGRPWLPSHGRIMEGPTVPTSSSVHGTPSR